MQPSHALQTLASGQRQRQLPSVVIVARRLLLATANGSQNSPTGAATYRPSKLTPTGHRNRRATVLGALPILPCYRACAEVRSTPITGALNKKLSRWSGRERG